MRLCEGCARHVRDSKDGGGALDECPFCGAPTRAIEAKPRRRVHRAVLLGAAAAVGVACGGQTAPDDGGSSTDAKLDQQQQQDIAVQPPYGVPPMDGGVD